MDNVHQLYPIKHNVGDLVQLDMGGEPVGGIVMMRIGNRLTVLAKNEDSFYKITCGPQNVANNITQRIIRDETNKV